MTPIDEFSRCDVAGKIRRKDSKGNYPKMAELCRCVNYYDLSKSLYFPIKIPSNPRKVSRVQHLQQWFNMFNSDSTIQAVFHIQIPRCSAWLIDVDRLCTGTNSWSAVCPLPCGWSQWSDWRHRRKRGRKPDVGDTRCGRFHHPKWGLNISDYLGNIGI